MTIRSTISRALLAAAAFALGTLPAPALAADDLTVPHEALAMRFLEAHGKAASAPEDVELAEILDARFLDVPLGLFRVHMPVAAVEQRGRAEDLRDICAALLDAQQHWLEWVDPEAGGGAELRADLATVRAWVQKWKSADLRRAMKGGSRDARELLDASDDVRAAEKRLSAALIDSGGPLDLERIDASRLRLVLAPERRNFLELLCFAGWWKPDLKSVYWQQGIETWMEFHVEGIHVCALEHYVPGKAGDFAKGATLNEKNPRRLQQQIVQLALNQLLRGYYDDALPPSFAGALSLNLVIDVFGEVDTRVDGDLGSNETSARSMFVTGGQSQGGSLPQDVADSRWRLDKGKDHFVRVLRQVQKNGSKEKGSSPNALARFQLRSRDQSEKLVVEAPFLGPVARPPAVSAGLRGDYLEFLRAYGSAFQHWLRTEASDAPDASRASFARLLARMARPENDGRFLDVLEELYGVPLSDESVSEHCLEGRFLSWIASQKSR